MNQWQIASVLWKRKIIQIIIVVQNNHSLLSETLWVAFSVLSASRSSYCPGGTARRLPKGGFNYFLNLVIWFSCNKKIRSPPCWAVRTRNFSSCFVNDVCFHNPIETKLGFLCTFLKAFESLSLRIAYRVVNSSELNFVQTSWCVHWDSHSFSSPFFLFGFIS